MRHLFYLVLLLICSVGVWGEQKIAPNSDKIIIEGAMHIQSDDNGVVINRHSDELWNHENVLINKPRARTQSGVRIVFKTDSKTIKPLFSSREDADLRKATNFYGIYRNGEFVGNMNGNELLLTSSGGICKWEIVLPIMYGVDFKGLIIDDGAKMFEVEKEHRPVYVAIGNSITHGAGQTKAGSNSSYPYVLAREKGYCLYNLAVGGSQITPAIAYELKDIKADIITVMWGFNDWNATNGDLQEIRKRYSSLLALLREKQPTAKIYCITATTAKDEAGEKKGKKGKATNKKPHLDEVRVVQREVAEAQKKKGDNNIFVIEGNKISSVEDLEGNVHFNNAGAQKFGSSLAKQIK